MIRKLPSGEYRLYSRKKDPKTGRRRNLGTFSTREAALKHERAVQYFKRAGESPTAPCPTVLEQKHGCLLQLRTVRSATSRFPPPTLRARPTSTSGPSAG